MYPISPWLKELIDATLQGDHFVKIMIGMNMVVEGLALAAFHNMRRQATCPLLRDLTDYVLRDESRHVAFGNVYVKETIAAMHPDEREDVAQFAFDAVKSMVDSQGGVDGKGQRQRRSRLLQGARALQHRSAGLHQGPDRSGRRRHQREAPARHDPHASRT